MMFGPETGRFRVSPPNPPAWRAGKPNAIRIWWFSTATSFCPGGTSDNSPTFQHWVAVPNEGPVPKSRLNEYTVLAVPSGLTPSCSRPPNVETLGYCRTSLRDEDKILVSFTAHLCPIEQDAVLFCGSGWAGFREPGQPRGFRSRRGPAAHQGDGLVPHSPPAGA